MSNESIDCSLKQEKPIDLDNPDKRYQTLFEQINGAAFLTTFEGQILEANQKSCDLFGYRWDELLRLSLKNLLPKETEWTQFQEEIAAKGGINTETHCISKDGSYIPVELSVSLFKMDNKPVMFVLTWDITERKEAEIRLKESEKKYHGLFEYATDGILVLDARGDILDVNTRLCEMLDLKKDEIIGKNLFSMDFLSTKSLPIVVNQFEQLLSEKKAQYYTAQIKTKKDTQIDVEVSSFFLVKKDKEVDNFIVIIRDITDRNQAEENLIKEHDLLKTLLNNIPDSVYFKDEQNKFILVNKAKADHSNVSQEEMINKTDFDFLPEEQAKRIFDDDNHIIQSGHPIINKLEKITHLDGSERWVSVSKVPRYNSEGDIIGTMGISRDITLQKKAEDELVKIEQRYNAIFDNSSFAIIQTNEHGQIISWNRFAENLLQMNYDHLNEKHVQVIYPPEEWEKIQSIFGQDRENKQTIETKVKRKDGNQVDIDLLVNTSKDENGNVVGYTYIINEISKRKQAECELEENREYFSFLLNSIPYEIFFKDENNRYILINKAKAKSLNINPEAVVGKTDFDFLPQDIAQRIYDEDKKILETGNPIIDKTEKINNSDGTEGWFSITKLPRCNKDKKIVGILGISQDITKWKKSKERKKNK